MDSSVGKLYAEEEFATDIVLDTIITIDLKSNGLQWIVLFDLATKTDSKCTEDGHFIPLSGTSLCFDSDSKFILAKIAFPATSHVFCMYVFTLSEVSLVNVN